MKYSLVKKGAALAVAAAVTLSAGNVALAGFEYCQGRLTLLLRRAISGG